MRKKVRPDGFRPLLTVIAPNVAQVFWEGRAFELLKIDAAGSGVAAVFVVVPKKTASPAGPLGVFLSASKLSVTLVTPVVLTANS